MLFLDSFMIFGFVSKVVTSIVFKPQINKMEITYLGKFLFEPKVEQVDPSNIVRKKALNPFVEYRKVDGTQKFCTIGTSDWLDRKLFNSLIKSSEKPKELKYQRTDE